MNSKPDTQISITGADVEKRLADERNRLNAELSLQSRLQSQRLAALGSGDNDALEVVEGNLNGCLVRQENIEERIELLEAKLGEVKLIEEGKRLDELAAHAERNRQRGIKIILELYPSLAKKLTALLAELVTCETTIQSANIELHGANRPMIDAANTVRLIAEPLTDTVRLPAETSDCAAHWMPVDPMLNLLIEQLRVGSAHGRGLLSP